MALTIASPFPACALPRVWAWMEPFRGRVADDFAARTLEQFVAEFLRRKHRTWAVCRDGELGGVITFDPWSPFCGLIHITTKKGFWGPAAEAGLRAVLAEIFEQGYRKIVCLTFRDNLNVLALVRKVGFKREGLLRQQTLRDGKPESMALMGLTAEDYGYELVAGSGVDRREFGGRSAGEPPEDKQDEGHGIAYTTSGIAASPAGDAGLAA